MRKRKADLDIFRDEIKTSYVDWKVPDARTIREIIKMDIGLIRQSAVLFKISDDLREAGISGSMNQLSAVLKKSKKLLEEMDYLFSDRERLCR
jgi:hypothetical protein